VAQIPFKTKIVNGQLQLVRPFQFINKKIEKEFLNLIEEAQNFSGAAGTAPEKYKVSNIAKKYKLGVSTLERILRDLRQTGKIPERAASIPMDVVRVFYPELLDKDGNLSKQKWLSTPSETRKAIAGKAIVEGVEEGLKPGGKVEINKKQGKEIKQFLDKFIELEKKGLEGRLFLGNSPSRWIKTDVRSNSPAKELYQEIAKAGSFKRNFKDASSFQFTEEFNDPKYQKSLRTILAKYLEPNTSSTSQTGDYRVKNKIALRKKYLNDVYNKDLKSIINSKEFKKVTDIEDAIKLVNSKLSDTFIYPNISTGTRPAAEIANTPFNFFTYGSSAKELKTKPFDTVANAFLKTANGKLAIKELNQYVNNQRSIGRINVLSPNAIDLIDEKYENYRSAMDNSRLDVFFKPLRKLGVIIDYKEKAGKEVSGNTADRIDALNKVEKIVPQTLRSFFGTEARNARTKLYETRYRSNLQKIFDLPERFKQSPTSYKDAVQRLNKVLSAQLGGLELAGEHRFGMGLLDKTFNPNYVSRIVLGSNAFNNMKNKIIESEVARGFNNPRYKPETRAKIYNDAAEKFVKEFELPKSIAQTLPKFKTEKGKLIETQLEKNVKRLGIDGLGNLKATVKNALVEQALVDKKMSQQFLGGRAADNILKKGGKNAPLVSKILNIIEKEGAESNKIDKLVNNLVEGEFEKTVNAESMAQFGRRFCKDGCLATTVDKDPGIAKKGLEKTINKFANVLPRLGTVGKIGTVAAGTGLALSGLRFNPEKGEIVTTDNDQKADQNQILQYVKDNPLKVTAGSSLGFAAQEVPGAYKAARDLGRGRVRSTLGISGAIRPVLTTFGTPLLTGLYEGAIGAKRLDEGETMTDILTDPVGPALGLTLMEPLSKLSGVVKDAPKRTMLEGAKNYFNLSNVGQARPGLTGQILRMGLSPRMIAGASRFLGLPGIALGAGLAGYDAYKNYQNQEGMIYNLFNKDG